MRKFDLELIVGIFVLAGLLCLAFMSVKLAKKELFSSNGYELYAIFNDAGGLKTGSSVIIAGIQVGRVKSITMESYEAKIVITLPESVKIQEDAIASIKTRGLIGEKYLSITPGGSEIILSKGERIRETMPAVDIEELISNYVFGKV
ncbi:MAG: outer membrane lipid asymmetry maintenance protein MlaD [Deltaproteobacteria bacterium]|nr:outer membrane lipid asymmetry maintenance protein MlaD [Deltaproteobacteria bacterium]